MFGVDKGMWVGKGEKVSAAAANHAVTAGRSSPVSTNTSSLSWSTPGPRTQAVRHPLSTSPGVSG